MIFNPIFIVSRFLVNLVVSKSALPSTFTGLALNMFTVARELIRQQGFFPTIAAVRYIQDSILLGRSLAQLSASSVISPVIMLPFINVLQGYWSDCLKNVGKMSRFYKLFRVSLFISTFPSTIFRAIRVIFGLIMSSLAVLFSPDEVVGGYLKDLCYTFIEFIEGITPFQFIPRFVSSEEPTAIKEVEEVTKSTYSLSGIIMIGLFGITVPLCLANYFMPDLIKSLPLIGNPIITYTNFVNSCATDLFTLVRDYFFKPDSDSPQIPQPTEKEISESFRGTPPAERPVRVPRPFEKRSDLGMRRGFLNGRVRRNSSLRNEITESIE
uniref:CSC1/OSCA1-like 7TM region domain-containing protein n=1 Tax=Coniophora puteana TaxID=80637 RepID=A0A896Z9S7_9AGAM